jgi:uncharacterized repeat protein (TIGR02543 family)
MTTTVLSVGIAGTASAASATLIPVGSFTTNSSSGLTIASASLKYPGDVLAIWVQSQNQTPGNVTGITATSGPGAIGTAVKAIAYTTVQHANNDDEIWYAPVTTAGAVTLTFAWSGTAAGNSIEYSTQEFQPSSTSTYATDIPATGSHEVSVSSATVTFPSLTPAGADELYLGYNSNNTNGVYGAPTTSGYTPESGNTGDAIIFNADAGSGAQAPSTTATDSSSGSTQSAIGAMIIATAATGNTVTFYANGGTGTMTNETATGATNLTPNDYTFAGYTFNDWTTASNGSGLAYANDASYPFSSSGPLYAQWTATSQTVTYNLGGGTGITLPTQPNVATAGTFTVYNGTNPTKAGYTFNGWSDGTNPYADGATYTMGASNVTLTAQWAATSQTVTYNLGGGTGITLPTQPNVATAGTFTVYNGTNPTKAGYTFNGWSDGTNPYADGATYTMGASNVTLTAQWTTNVVVGGGGGVAPTISTLNVTASNLSVTSGGAVTPSVTVSGLNTGDTAVASGITYTYAGTGSTTYAASATAPSAVGTYSITPSGGTMTVSPSTDQANYAGTYTYVPGTLTITAAVTVTTVTSPPPPHVVFHVARVVGKVVAGRTVVVTIDGTGFYGQPRIISSTGRTTIARVTRDTGKVLTVRVTVKSGTALGTHTFTIILANGKKSVVRFVLR